MTRRQNDELNSSHLSAVCEESESDLMSEKLPSRFSMLRSSDDPITSTSSSNWEKNLQYVSNNSDVYFEATGQRNSSDHGVVLTTDTDSFIIGQRVWVGGVRPGNIAYIGETHFAPGDWAGIVLDVPNGKNDGCVAGKRYFQCEPKRGIFSRLTRLTREPLATTPPPLPPQSSSNSDLSLNINSRCSTSPLCTESTSPTQSVKSLIGKMPSKNQITVGDRVIVSSGLGSRPGLLKFMGETQFAPGTWCGVQLDEPTGKNDGTVSGIKYFECPTQYGIFVPIAKVSLSPSARKIRLSKSGSIESLNSICTVDSIASTATSRMRSNLQRQSSTSKLTSTPKNTFSLQDVLREKQNHIEQLLMERDLDRQDTESQLFASQKTINGLKEKISKLEKNLEDERRKTEDLQFSIDEVTYCRDDIPLPTMDNETTQIDQTAINTNDNETLKLEIVSVKIKLENKTAELLKSLECNQKLHEELSMHVNKLKNIESNFNAKQVDFDANEKCLQNEIENLKQKQIIVQNVLDEQTKKHDENIGKLKVTEKQLKEKIINLQDELKLRDAIVANYDGELKDVIADKEELEKQTKNICDAKENFQIQLQQKIEELELNKISQQTILAEQSVTKSLYEELMEKNEQLHGIVKEKDQLLDNLNKNLNNVQYEIESHKENESQQNQLITKKYLEDIRKLNEENNALKEMLVQTENNYKNIINNLSKEKTTILNETNDKINNISETIDSVNKEKSNVENKMQEINQILNEKLTENNELQALVQSISLENNKLLSDISTIENNLQIKCINMQQLDEEKQALNVTIQLKTDEIETQQINLLHTNEQLQLLTNECNQLKVEIGTFAEAEKKVNVEKNIAFRKMNDEILELTKQFDQLTKERDLNLIKIHELEQTLANNNEINQDKSNIISNFEKDILIKNNLIEKQAKEIDEVLLKFQTTIDDKDVLQLNFSKLEIEHGDLGRKMIVLGDKLEQAIHEKAAIQENLEMLQNSSSDTNGEISRLNEQLKQKQIKFDECVNKSNEIQLDLEKRLHEMQQNVMSITASHEKTLLEIDTVKEQKVTIETELTDKLDQMTNNFVEKQNALQTIEVALLTSESRKTELNHSILKLEQQINELIEELKNQEKTFAMKKNEFEIAENELKIVEQNMRLELEKTHEHIQLKNIETKSEMEIILKNNDELKNQLKNQEIAINSLENSVCEFKEKYTKSEGNCMEIQTNSLATINDYENLKVNWSIEKNELENQISELNGKYKQIEDEQVDLVDRNERLKNDLLLAENQIQQLQTDILAENNEIKLKEIELNVIKTNLNDNQLNFNLKIKNLQETIEYNNNQIKLFENQLENLTKISTDKNDECQLLNEHLNDHKNEMEKLKIEINQLVAKLNDYQTIINEKNEEIKVHQSKIGQLTSSVNLSDDLKNELNHKSEEIRTKNNSIVELNSVVTILRQEIAGKDLELKQINETKYLECQQSMDELVAKNQDLIKSKMDVETLNSQIEEQNNNLNKINDEKTQLIVEKKELVKKIECLQLNIDQLNTENIHHKMGIESEQKFFSDFQLIKENEIVQLKQQLNEKLINYEQTQEEIAKFKQTFNDFSLLEEKHKSKEMQLNLENKLLSDKLKTMKASTIATASDNNDDIGAQISFLNSIIADMHQKNEMLSKRVQTLEATPADILSNGLYDIPIKRQPAPRLFCDICDIFDAHETEDCPMQSSDSPPPLPQLSTNNVPITQNDSGKKQKPPPRKYCELCEEFDHDTEECPKDETY